MVNLRATALPKALQQSIPKTKEIHPMFRFNRFVTRSIALAATLLLANTSLAAGTYTVDPAHSSASFKIKHLGVSSVSGRFNDLSGTVVLDAADESKNKVEIEIKTASIDTGINKRDDHLRNADFFDVEKYPVMSFKSTSFKKKSDNLYEVKGDFTLHGTTKSITIDVEQTGSGKGPKGNEIVGFETEFKIDRTEYGMPHSTGVGDEVKISFAAECSKKA
jgi:polyisoprenoid-binding protein YceI